MKLTAGKRVLMFFHWLLSALICAAFVAYLVKPEFVMDLYNRVTGKLTPSEVMIIGIALLAIYVILAVAQLFLIFRRGRRGDRGFITVDSSETGRVRIAVSAIEQMVRQSVTEIEGIHEMKVNIASDDDAIKIDIAAIIVGGSHVPTITVNMQRSIRQFVEMNCGVAVRSVSISINSVTALQEGKGRWGRGKHENKPVMPAPEVVNASRPVESYAPPETSAAPMETPPTVSLEKPVEAAPVYVPEAPVEPKTPEVPEGPAPIRLTLDYAPAYESEEASEAPETPEEETD